MSYLVAPDGPEGAGEGAQAASGALFHVKGRHVPLFGQGPGEAGHGAGCLLTVVAEDGDRGEISDEVDGDGADPLMDALAGDLAGSAADASSDVDVNRHFSPSGRSWRPRN